MYQRRAEVATIGGLSAHAGQNFLLEYAQAAQGDLKKIFLIHGEQKAAEALQVEMGKRGLPPAIYPEKNSAVEI
jgi:metallo-beta-lactamase family protein